MSAENILLRAERLRRRAEIVIARLGLRERWARVGDLILVGSARFGLMTTPNLDFEIYAERPDAAMGAAVMRSIAAEPGVTGVVHHDFLANPDDPGLYWRLDYRDECGEAWDCDIWLVPFSHPHAGMAEAFAQALAGVLTDGSRTAILRLKDALAVRAAADGTQRPRGIDIYRAVLEGGVDDAAGFDAWRVATPRPELETWRP